MEKNKIIINEQDIINTYPERNKEIASTYLNYLEANKDTNIFNLPFKSTFSNFLNFYDNISINYCKYKKIKLENTIKSWKARRMLEERRLFDQLRRR